MDIKRITREREQRVFEGLKKLTATGVVKNRCWWDAEICPYYSEIKGLQEAGEKCRWCFDERINKKRFISVLFENFILLGLKDLEDMPGFDNLQSRLC